MRLGDPICGDYGPRFVGYGKMPFRHRWLNWRGTVGLGFGMATLALTIMVLR